MADFKPTFGWLVQRPLCFLAFGFGSGLAPVAPGTFGTLPALPLAFVLHYCGVSGWLLAILCTILFAAGIVICNTAEKLLGIQDYGGIVWDEIVAMLLVLAFVPFDGLWWLWAFAVFRLFDAIKPFPIKWFDARIHGGFGIMLDDVIAAFMTLIVMNATVLLV
ncbi:phosphatidylglycerophosphatase A family protein [Neisseria chenwenguii]|uniref:Phosphatidylglycerophosphatase A n=1 Tax=Neisseria chenwenguii TaxID=1853278 RepID=A0A220S2Z2_9NEIS|nr:phosphatidylglycerophosphatase A [Neisseria chenwenguii]ASK27703.1 phosphatidylglycerophosphatase A [Neisseria chenwenguii]ROV55678.1 phosphatidylglycerophosphatase A [Neisseria chenwenguii]